MSADILYGLLLWLTMLVGVVVGGLIAFFTPPIISLCRKIYSSL